MKVFFFSFSLFLWDGMSDKSCKNTVKSSVGGQMMGCCRPAAVSGTGIVVLDRGKEGGRCKAGVSEGLEVRA